MIPFILLATYFVFYFVINLIFMRDWKKFYIEEREKKDFNASQYKYLCMELSDVWSAIRRLESQTKSRPEIKQTTTPPESKL
jgi:hypothetical protein